MDRHSSGPPAVPNHHLHPPFPTTTHTILAADITPIDTCPTLTVAHPVTQPHLYQVFNYETYPSWPPLRRNVSVDKLPTQRQQWNEFAAGTAWMHDDALPEYYTLVKATSSSGEATGNIHAADISPIKTSTTHTATTTKPGRKRYIRGPRGPYKKRQRANSDTSTITDSTAATTTDNSDKKGPGELRVKKRRHGGGRKKGEVVCNLCGVEFTRPFTLKRHLVNMHAESAVCVCGIRFKGEGDRALHVAGGTCGET